VQYTTTTTTASTNLGGNILVDTKKKLIKSGIIDKGVTHWLGPPNSLSRTQETAPLDNLQVI